MTTTLILGGSGFVSGAMARTALARGDKVFVLTRGNKSLPAGVIPLTADRNDSAAFAHALAPHRFDRVVDCIGFDARHAQQDLDAFFPPGAAPRAGHLVFLSSDFALSAVDRPPFIDETFDRFDTAPYGAGKRAAEVVLMQAAGQRRLPITVLRPCHIYGPGSLLGCLPLHGRDAKLPERLRQGEPLKLLGGGHFLQHPIYVDDLVAIAFACAGLPAARGEVFFAGGPEVIESRTFYRIIAELLGVSLSVEEVSIADYLKTQPDHRAFCCHRLYKPDKARAAGLPIPAIAMREGLERHLKSMK
ncbi:MAG TPA: NAD-dependent epimerase/dehydratase family protein [Phycisphaerae bacterium]|nr:NAD-dependent epimerase/dehydratase family protein [Phycisphaerae bacterium]